MLIKYRSLMVFLNLDSGETLTKHIFYETLVHSSVLYGNIAIFNLKGFMDTTGSKKETDLCPLITPKKIF